MRRAVIFDLDGTLVDSAAVCVDIFNTMLAERGCTGRLSAPDIQHALSIGGVHMVKAAMGTYSPNPAADLAEFRRRYELLPTPANSLYPGAREALTALSADRYLLGLCTKKPIKLAQKVLRELGLADFFGAVSGGDSTPHPKPDPRHLGAVLDELGVMARDAWMVGDSAVDDKLSRAAGVRFVFATYGYGRHEVDTSTCSLVVDALSELHPRLLTAPHAAGERLRETLPLAVG